ncbi:ribonuclease H-like domain-containing protein [Talaromyces proteolyticus]|uniref:Ribonuclease H-like domain-containing protein n=1 Tax=Talaromyces proteolyticus TaxID=1131652 RepID=A0AAD4PZA1_9EURO|nr:ribonuclease H-like domain-containing protein [Talaromyces proteolyticus]KAH8696187.1 ribonuclease H-like domain-containing protein [Talaromyces proteolyticus]
MSNTLQQDSLSLGGTTSGVTIPIVKTPAYIEKLNSLAHHDEVLAAVGYVVKELSSEELEGKKRCSGCGKQMSQVMPKKAKNKNNKKPPPDKDVSGQLEACIISSPAKDTTSDSPLNKGDIPASNEPHMRCKFHSGLLQFKVWSCCGGNPMDAPCTKHEFHIPRPYAAGEIERLWQFHSTGGGKRQSSYRKAVAIDCEMGTAKSGDSELIRITLLDYFSGQILIDKLVYPDVPMLHFNTRYSGVRRIDLNNARREGSCFYGRNSARTAILKFVGPSTVIVGHSAQNDLKSLRWIHHKIVDTYIIESSLKEAAERMLKESSLTTPPEPPNSLDVNPKKEEDRQKSSKGRGMLSLKTLSKVKLGRDIQTGRNGHDSVEDALAARDLVHFYLTNSIH